MVMSMYMYLVPTWKLTNEARIDPPIQELNRRSTVLEFWTSFTRMLCENNINKNTNTHKSLTCMQYIYLHDAWVLSYSPESPQLSRLVSLAVQGGKHMVHLSVCCDIPTKTLFQIGMSVIMSEVLVLCFMVLPKPDSQRGLHSLWPNSWAASWVTCKPSICNSAMFCSYCCTSNSRSCSHTCYTRVLARPFPKGTVSFGAPNVPFGSAQKPTMCPLVPPQNQHIFNSHLNYLNLKTVWALNIELSELKTLCWQWYTCKLVLTITTFKMKGVVTICALWPVNSGENTVLHCNLTCYRYTAMLWYKTCMVLPYWTCRVSHFYYSKNINLPYL